MHKYTLKRGSINMVKSNRIKPNQTNTRAEHSWWFLRQDSDTTKLDFKLFRQIFNETEPHRIEKEIEWAILQHKQQQQQQAQEQKSDKQLNKIKLRKDREKECANGQRRVKDFARMMKAKQ